MLDDRTASVWSHLDGGSLTGEYQGQRLEILPLQSTTWGAWRTEHPDTTVLDPDTGYRYRGEPNIARSGLGRTFRATLDGIDERLPDNELVIGVLAGSEAAAFPIDSIRDGLPTQSEVGGIPIVILASPDGEPSLAYHRALTDGRILDFERASDGGVRDVQTGSRWASDGRAVEGELAGVQLTFVTSFLSEWYGWAAFNPDTTIGG
jgi:Protein of unknown function (DUF3179)